MSLTYVHASDNNDLQTGFASPARPKGRALQVGSINTFLEMQDIFTVYSTDSTDPDASYLIRSFSGDVFAGVFDLNSGASSSVRVAPPGPRLCPARAAPSGLRGSATPKLPPWDCTSTLLAEPIALLRWIVWPISTGAIHAGLSGCRGFMITGLSTA